MLQDTLATVLSTIKNAEKVGKRECITKASKEVKNVLELMHKNGYIGGYEFVDDGRQGKFKIELKGRIIDCNVVKPRFAVKIDEFEKWEKRFLPAREFGLLILSTPKGIIDHKKAKEIGIGGRLMAFVY